MILRTVIGIVFGFQIMLNITRPIISLFASKLGASTLEIGILTATYAFFPLVLAIYAGKIADYVGDRLPVMMGTVGMAVGMLLPFCFPTMWSLFLSQAIVGISQIIMNISLQNVLGNAATTANRDHYFGLFSMAVALGGVIGPAAGGYLVEQFSYPIAFLVSGFTGLVPFVLSLFVPVIIQKKEQDNEPASSSLHLLKMPALRKALASSALVLYSRDIFVAYFPLYALKYGISPSGIGWILAVQGLTMVTVRLSLSILIKVFGRNLILWASILAAGFSFLMVPFAAGSTLVFILLSALMGAGLGIGQPLSMTTTYNASPKTRTGEVLGLRLASNRLSQMIAPLFFGLIGSWAGIGIVFYISGAFLIGGAFLTKEKSING